MKRLSLIVSAVSATLMLSGCGSLTGFSNAKTDFACADLSGGPSCRNISQVYEENNPTTPVVLAASEEDFVQPFFEPNQTKSNPEVKAEPAEVSVERTQTSAVERTSDFVTIVPARPWRKPETVLRVWLAPFHDKLGDLHDQRYLYVRLENGGWTTDSVNELVSSSRLSKPVYPLSSDQPQDPNEAKREKLKQLPAFGFTGKP
ncbi:type IV conjugative transfer system lipoprotein TraV [Parasutterella excrementihominis]|uniref:type IV conjugative transfer system lipoprotein TraV n=1 Tax=Parasutterella excrementihominis TaxID=487175 RepID=UPI0025B14934|nr:type IV conjugative transfer system lipoprotein TraV [Parasutterella excrementihominis]